MRQTIVIKGARAHNLKNIDIEIPRDKLIVFTGLSGSGKSSLAFDTIYAEGQRRYVESLSSYARQFLGQMEKRTSTISTACRPLYRSTRRPPAAIPRSTVGTVTEIHDYLRPALRAHRHPSLPQVRPRYQSADRRSDGRSDNRAARAHATPDTRAGRARPQGRTCARAGEHAPLRATCAPA